MPAPLIWLVLILGLATVAAAFLLPRELGKEDQPLVNLPLDFPPVESLLARARQARPFHHAATAAPTADEASADTSPFGASQPSLPQTADP